MAELPRTGHASLLGAAPEAILEPRLRALGLGGHVRAVRTHANRTVMVSLTAAGVLRIHRDYALAPDRILQAVVRFVGRWTRRADRLAAQRVVLSYAVSAPPAERRRREERARPGDEAVLARLRAHWEACNAAHFAGALSPIPIVLSGRMKTRLGQLDYDQRTGRPTRIALSRRLVTRFAWDEVEATLLHEMVHQWQAETGQPVDHGRGFRDKARAVGIVPRAVVDVVPRGAGNRG